jgi:hypothetical protein
VAFSVSVLRENDAARRYQVYAAVAWNSIVPLKTSRAFAQEYAATELANRGGFDAARIVSP